MAVVMQRSDANNRGAILAAAREELGAHGYDGMTLRQVAARAGVDPRLVRYYFSSKRELVRACIEARLDGTVTEELTTADERSVGHQLVRRVVYGWRDDAVSHRALLATVLSEEEGEQVVAWLRSAVEPTVRRFAPDRHCLRSALICAHLLGLGMVVGVAGAADSRRSTEQLVQAAGDAVQRLISAPLPPV